jgi:CheY-like chemotaxis protein
MPHQTLPVFLQGTGRLPDPMPGPGDGPEGSTGRSARLPVVLLIDDSEEDRELIGAAFAHTGQSVNLRWCRSAEQALAYFEGRPPFSDRARDPLPDLVLLDIQMPGRDGFDVLSWLRTQSADFHRVPVVMLSTSRTPEEIRRAYDEGANSFLAKPTGFVELCELIGETARYWLRRNRS